MSTPARLGAFAAALVVALFLGFGVGRAAGPIDVGSGDAPTHHRDHGVDR